ncbi:hypothetical protein MNBD_GAMMA01-1483, partial [hydrothermal vent metagenome]
MEILEPKTNNALKFKLINNFTILWMLLLFAVSSANAVTINVDTTISASDASYDNQDLTIDAAVLTIDGIHTFLNVQLINGATITHTQGINGANLSMVNLSIDATSKIDLSGKGKAFVTGEITGLAGASHAGLGIIRTNEITNGSYGDLRQPAELGSSTSRKLGGGSIRLNVSN